MSERKWYKLIFKQVQPIHIGSGSYGVIDETRVFIPGWTMWGALTKAYNLERGLDLSLNQNLFENISCFYPAFKKENNFEILFPEFQDGEFYLGDYPEDEFRAKFVDTFVSTAIKPLSNTALDESLHELNVILTCAKVDFIEYEKEKQLYWIGIIQIDDELKDFFKEGLKQKGSKIFIGADVRYGYGEIELTKYTPLEEKDKDFWWINNDNIEIKTNRPSPYFIEAKENLKIEGEVLLIPEIDFRENIPKITDARFFASVGSKVENLQQNLKLKKGKLTKENNNANGT